MLSLSSSCEFYSFVYLFNQEPCFIFIFIPDSRIDKRTVSKGLLRLRLQINISWSPHRCKHYKWQVMELIRTHQVVRSSAIFIFFLLLKRHRCILFQSFSEKEGTDYRKKQLVSGQSISLECFHRCGKIGLYRNHNLILRLS